MKIHKVLGLMSGTSLDGLDMALCHFWQADDGWEFNIKEATSIRYDSKLQNKLHHAIGLTAIELLEFHNQYGSYLGKQVKQFINMHNLVPDLVASHGHTTHHRPDIGVTFQIGSGQHLANTSKQKVICDFRTGDIALGGQGAPLVPIGDRLLFSQYNFCLNLGGIANISFEENNERHAYDIGLANMILNYITQKINLAYDEGGQRASRGIINAPLLSQLNALPFYKLPYPKSIGYEWFLSEVVPLVENTDDSVDNLLHTAVHHICDQIAAQVLHHAKKSKQTLFITGGGALNHFLIKTLGQKLGASIQVVVPSRQVIEYKEAVIFALMGLLRQSKQINVLRSATGATSDSSSGVIYLPS